MILIVVLILWLLTANSIWSFLIPIFCIFIRAAYSSRSVRVFKISPIIFATFLFIYNFFSSDISTETNLINSVRIVVFSALLIHIFEGVVSSPSTAFPKISYHIYSGTRILSIVIERLSDTMSVFYQRARNLSWRKVPKLIGYAFSNFLTEILIVHKTIELVNYEKGGSNNITSWETTLKYNPNKKIWILSYLTVGDIFLILLLLSTFIFEEKLLPQVLLNFIELHF